MIRILRYLTFRGFMQWLGTVSILGGVVVFLLTFVPILFSELKYEYNKKKNIEYVLDDKTIDNQAHIDGNGGLIPIEPINKDFSIVIEKIGVNAPVIPNVSVSNKVKYGEALERGVAHADGTVAPGQTGNMTLFAHSSLDFWNMGKYAKVFNLLGKTNIGDRIVIYYQNKPYVYEIFEKFVVKGWDTSPLTEDFDAPVITLITCDPPGTSLNRLVVRGTRIN